jgi:hypothetical protein
VLARKHLGVLKALGCRFAPLSFLPPVTFQHARLPEAVIGTDTYDDAVQYVYAHELSAVIELLCQVNIIA